LGKMFVLGTKDIQSQMTHGIKKEDIELVKGCRKRQPDCQNILFKKYYGKMLGVCLRYSDNREDAKDILLEGFNKVFNAIEHFDSKQSLAGWIKQIMINTAIDKYRKNQRSIPISDMDSENIDVMSEDTIYSQIDRKVIVELISKLPFGYRSILNMFAIEGYSHREISEKLDISVNTSKSQYYKAKALLKKMIENHK
jgi:RNA polymerase sigma factor (sigma-70 family)